MRYPVLFVCWLSILFPAHLAWAGDSTLMRAMEDELGRSLEELQLESLEKPYFISYRIDETHSQSAAATFGSLLYSRQDRTRGLRVEIRIGDYSLDNTNFRSYSSANSNMVRMYGGRIALPLEDNYLELRRLLWLATDVVYKKALEELAKKRALLQNKMRTEIIDDFSRADPIQLEALLPSMPMDLQWGEALVCDLSGIFRTMPLVAKSRVSLGVGSTDTYYVNSEGTRFVRTTQSLQFNVSASTQAADGIPLNDRYSVLGLTLEDLPEREVLVARIRALGERMENAFQAPLAARFTGPVLFEKQAAAELFVQGFAPYLVATRKVLSDNESYSRNAPKENPFLDKIGIRVLPEFLSVINAPDRLQWKGNSLIGHYRIDDEGVLSRSVALVEKGVLNTLLNTRNPARGIDQSNGSRRGRGAAPANLLISSKKTLGSKKMRRELSKLVKRQKKDYGIVIRRLGRSGRSKDGPTLGPALEAYKVYRDGREERMRNAEFNSFGPGPFKDIVAVAKKTFVHNTIYSSGGHSAAVSIVLPEGILFEDITIRPPSGEILKPPVAGHPYFNE